MQPQTKEIIITTALLSTLISMVVAIATVYILENIEVIGAFESEQINSQANTSEQTGEEISLEDSEVELMITEYEELLENENLLPDTADFYRAEIARLRALNN